MPNKQKITPCLWFDDQAEEAVALYTSTFNNAFLLQLRRHEAPQEQ